MRAELRKIFQDLQLERFRQDAKWGVQNHLPEKWFTILGEEFGEVAKAILENDESGYRKELIEVAAVAIAAVENYDRQSGMRP